MFHFTAKLYIIVVLKVHNESIYSKKKLCTTFLLDEFMGALEMLSAFFFLAYVDINGETYPKSNHDF